MMKQRFEAIYRYNSVFLTKYFTGLDLPDFCECNKTMFVGKRVIGGLPWHLLVSYISFLIFG